MADQPHTQLPAEIAGAYAVSGVLGTGAAATVYLAERRATRERVVLKVLARTAEGGRARFEREAQILARLDHPGIVRLLDHGVANGVMFMVLAFQKALTLAKVLEQVGSLKVERGMRLIRELVEAVAHAHDAGILHRDLKPANILVTKEWHARLIDFGIAHVEGAPALTRVGLIVGTPAYAAPEVLTGKAHDVRSDLYALGLVAYETLTGENPFARATLPEVMRAKLELEASALPPLPDGLDPRARATILRLLEIDPRRRFGSAAEVLAALDAPLAPAAAIADATGDLPRAIADMTEDLPPPATRDVTGDLPPSAVGVTGDLPPPALAGVTGDLPPPAPSADAKSDVPFLPAPSRPLPAPESRPGARSGSTRTRRSRRRARFVGPALAVCVAVAALAGAVRLFQGSRTLKEPLPPRASAPADPMTRLADVLERFDARAKNRVLCADYERRLQGPDSLAASARLRREWDARLAADAATVGLPEALAATSARIEAGDRALYARLAELDALCGTASFLDLTWQRSIAVPRCRRFRALPSIPHAAATSTVFVTGGSRADAAEVPPNLSIVTSRSVRAVYLPTGLRVPMAAPASFVPGAPGRHAEWSSPAFAPLDAGPRGTVPIVEVSLSLRPETIYRIELSFSPDGQTWRPPITLPATRASYLLHLVEPADIAGARFMRLSLSTGMQYTGLLFGCIVDAVAVHHVDPHANRAQLPVWDPSWD